MNPDLLAREIESLAASIRGCIRIPMARKEVLRYVRDELYRYADAVDCEIASLDLVTPDDDLADVIDPQRYA